jgi:hypothetical protein
MAHKLLIGALSMIVATSPLSATQPDSGPIAVNPHSPPITPAPPGTPDTRYCMRIELTGNVAEPVQCWTREEWAEQGVDVDQEWRKEGVAVVA